MHEVSLELLIICLANAVILFKLHMFSQDMWCKDPHLTSIVGETACVFSWCPSKSLIVIIHIKSRFIEKHASNSQRAGMLSSINYIRRYYEAGTIQDFFSTLLPFGRIRQCKLEQTIVVTYLESDRRAPTELLPNRLIREIIRFPTASAMSAELDWVRSPI